MTQLTAVPVLDVAAGLGFLAIAAALAFLVMRRSGLRPALRRVALLLAATIAAVALHHLVTPLTPEILPIGVRMASTLLSTGLAVWTAIAVWPLVPVLLRIPSAAALERERAALAQEVDEYRRTMEELGARHESVTRERDEARERLEAVLAGAAVTMFGQDDRLVYQWIKNPRLDYSEEQMIGQGDRDVDPHGDRGGLIRLKQEVIDRREPRTTELALRVRQGLRWFRLHLEPAIGADGATAGLIGIAVDITEIKELEQRHADVAAQLGVLVQRFEAALKGADIYVFDQDRGLHYTWLNKGVLGRTPEEFLGRTDHELFDEPERSQLVSAKTQVLDTGEPADAEVRINRTGGDPCWFDLHVAPKRDPDGTIVGVSCAAVDVTERKEHEQQIRVVMRELTHRSKNLLAVVQAMARQTATGTESVQDFVDRFGARLRGLAASHDLLVAENWIDVALDDLLRDQLAHMTDQPDSALHFAGPHVRLVPEATQALGLALHELGTNAAKHGALSVVEGRIEVTWSVEQRSDGKHLVIAWQETGGPPVQPPRRKGFGHAIIERNVARSLDAEVTLEFREDGLACRFDIPDDYFTDEARGRS